MDVHSPPLERDFPHVIDWQKGKVLCASIQVWDPAGLAGLATLDSNKNLHGLPTNGISMPRLAFLYANQQVWETHTNYTQDATRTFGMLKATSHAAWNHSNHPLEGF